MTKKDWMNVPLGTLEASVYEVTAANGYLVNSLNEDAKTLESTAAIATARAVYLRARAAGRTHAQAVRKVNTAQRQLAKMLGFSYPDLHAVKF